MDKKKIMIAEDDAGILDAMQIILEDAGYDITTIGTGPSVPHVIKQKPDLLLLDIWMSGINGTTICKKLKSHTKTKDMPIIICSANRDTQKLTKECGADDFISKPFEMEELLGKVDKYLHK